MKNLSSGVMYKCSFVTTKDIAHSIADCCGASATSIVVNSVGARFRRCDKHRGQLSIDLKNGEIFTGDVLPLSI